MRAVNEIEERLGALLQARHRRAIAARSCGVSLAARPRRPAICGSSARSPRAVRHRRLCADVVAVETFELGEIEPRRRAADLRQVERRDHLLGRDDLLVAMAPAEPDQIIAQRRRQIAHGAIGVDAERTVALRQFRAVGAVDQRDMRHYRHRPAERVVDLFLPGGVGQMIVAADDMGHAHVVVVDDDRQLVGRRAVGAQQDEVVEVLVCQTTRPCT